ncbi:hypothetical protein CLV84_1679 [Neolewinella xylanilytica]|uniref:Uncharacterized protein n=1 Tax=Neolewinella xylanilytica TaxID=1514080 RepID=A0A2S6IB35_9BACT|nr:hypothetical protein [Neolewinella xylanilytica]PPK88708.1 hypothetical protein CLV84_1679 [Neolewinella xylanilytica]
MLQRTFLCLFVTCLFSAFLSGQGTRGGSFYLDGGASLLQYARIDYPEFGVYFQPYRLQGRQESWRANVLPIGYFLTDRFLVGVRFDYQKTYSDDYWASEQAFGESDTWSSLRPFVRYYPLSGNDRRWDVFGEVGFGRIGLKGYTGIETDFHLAAGIDYRLGSGVLATARLAYNGFATDLNYTTLEIGPRILLNEISGPTGQSRLARGTGFVRGALFRGSVGHMRRQGEDWLDYRFEITPSAGYFFADGLAVVAEVDWKIGGEYNYLEVNSYPARYGNHVLTDFQTSLGMRYYPLRTSRLVPFAGLSAGHYRYEYDHELENSVDTRVKAFTYRGTLGGTYFLSDRLALETLVSYTKRDERMRYRYISDGEWIDTASDRLVVEAGFVVYLGGQ